MAIAALAISANARSSRASLIQRIASADEIDSAWSFAPSVGTVVYANESGKGGIFALDISSISSSSTPAMRPMAVPTTLDWPMQPVVSPKGRWVAYHDLNPLLPSPEHSLFLTDRQTNQSRAIVLTDQDEFVSRSVFSPDESTLVYELVRVRRNNGVEEWHDTIRALDLVTHTDRELVAPPNMAARGPTITADGRSVVFGSTKCVYEVPLQTSNTLIEPVEIACLPEGMTPYPKDTIDAPVLSPTQDILAMTVSYGGCPHIAVAERSREKGRASRFRLLSPDECGMRPEIVPDEAPLGSVQVAYVGLPQNGNRVARIRAFDGSNPRSLGPERGIVYGLKWDPSRRRLVGLAGTPTTARSFWTYDPKGIPLGQRIASASSTSTSTDVSGESFVAEDGSVDGWAPSSDGVGGALVPVRVIRPRKPRSTRNPFVVFLHGSPQGHDDISPRLYKEIAYFLANGITVVSPNYGGSTGFGPQWLERTDPDLQAADVLAATRWAKSLPDLDPKNAFLIAICYAATSILERAVVAEPNAFRGVVSWAGPKMPWLDTSSSSASPSRPERPDLAWIIAGRDPQAVEEIRAARDLTPRKNLHIAIMDDTHFVRTGEARRIALETVMSLIQEPRE